jgi:hypothetical protein
MPDGDISDIARALRLSAAAMVISAGPLVACVLLIPGISLLTGGRSLVTGPAPAVVHAQAEPSPEPGGVEEDEPGGEDASGEAVASPPEDLPPPGEEAASPAALGAWLLLVLAALAWWVLYAPVALVVAALSKSMISTLNPLIGVDTIRKMGSTYWQALALYLAIVAVQAALGFVLGYVPLAGSLLRSFVDAYGTLAVGCTLGLAVFKKAVELGWD